MTPDATDHAIARALHDALAQLGIVLEALTVRQDTAGVVSVAIPPLPMPDVARLLDALGPALGPHGPHLARPTPRPAP